MTPDLAALDLPQLLALRDRIDAAMDRPRGRGVPERPDLAALPWPQALRAGRAEGMGMSALARALGCSCMAVLKQARKHGVPFPSWLEASQTGLKERWQDEGFRLRHREATQGPLAVLTPEQRADYDVLKRNGYSRASALAAIGVQP